MNYITIQNLNELQSIIDADIYLSGSPYGQKEEIYNNTWQISFDRTLSLKLKKTDLENFFYELIEKRSQQIDEISKNLPVTFYMWIDEMSMQLCFNLISGQNPILPFGCKLNVINDRNIIFDHLLATIAQGGVMNYDTMIFYEKGDPRLDEIEDEDSSQNYVLDLHLVILHEQETIKNNVLQCIEEQTVIDRKFSYELMQIFLDNYCQNNFNQDLIKLVQNSRFQDKNRNSVMSNIIKPRIWQIWQQTIFKIMLQEKSKVLNFLIAFYATAYFLADYFDEFIDSVDEDRMAFFKKIILEFAIDKDNKPINVSFWKDWISAAEQLNTKYIELLHHTVSINTPISQDVACEIIQAWLEYKKDAIDIHVAQQVLADTQGMQQAIDEIKLQRRSYLLLDNEVTVLETYHIMIKLLKLHDNVIQEFAIDENGKPIDFKILLNWIRICEQVIKA